LVTGVGTSRRQLHLAEEPSLSLLGGAREEHLSGVCRDAGRPRRRNLLGLAALACYGAVRSSGSRQAGDRAGSPRNDCQVVVRCRSGRTGFSSSAARAALACSSRSSACLTASSGSPAPVVKPLDPEVAPELAVADVADVETFAGSVSSRTDDAVEATAAVTTARTTTDRLRVVPQQERARVIEPRKQAAASAAVSQDPAAAPLVLQEPKHVALGLPSRVRYPGRGSYPRGCAVRRGDESEGDRSYRTLCSRHWRRRSGEHSVGAGRLNPSRAALPAC